MQKSSSGAGTSNDTTKHIFVTGGVVSSLGKGLTAASLGNLLTARGLRVVMQKLDPYLNVDPGTMNPFQHGEVFVTDDGAETDLDIGHYERFLDIDLEPGRERHHRADLLAGDRPGAARRVPRRHGAGDPAHHGRDQAAHAPAGAPRRPPARMSSSPRSAARSATSSRSRSSSPRGRSVTSSAAANVLLRPRLARAVHGCVGGAEDQADAALRRGAPLDRHPARRARAAQRPAGHRGEQAQDRPHVRRRRGRRRQRGGRAEHLRHPLHAQRAGTRRVHRRARSASKATRSTGRGGSACCRRCTTPSTR